jgi:2-oxoglutarate dehydrogenase E1 component
VDEGIFAQDEVDAFSRAYFERLDAAYEAADSFRPNRVGSMCIRRAAIQNNSTERATERPAGLSPEQFRAIGLSLSQTPFGVSVNPKIVRQLQARESAIKSGEGISWAFAEALAYASLACEGIEIRLSGQDTPRGAFSQRHFILFDQDSGALYAPLNHLQPGQARCEIIDSPLSEYAVLGFEYGYSLDAAAGLTVWEAQFGDFANVAQVIVDQFIASAEEKWLDASGLTLLLPHGQEGQGPDHSSGRIERFLQLCANNNMRVANCSTPANFFHLLRSQARMKPRRPLVVFTPKSLLRHKLLVSRASEFLGSGPINSGPVERRQWALQTRCCPIADLAP